MMGYRLQDFGSYTIGGQVHEVTEGSPFTVNFTRQARNEVDPRGHFHVGQTYVQFFVPEVRRAAPPMVLIHGGGMHGSTWETTPDGRPGWLHLLLASGYEVHVVDLVERGRSGFAAGIWTETPLLRSAEEAWHLFRFGPPEGFATRQPFADQQFPISHFDRFVPQIVPRWLSNTALQVAGVAQVLERLGRATLLCHSQGGEIAFDVAQAQPDAVAGILAIEPSAVPPKALGCPVVLLAGDYLDTAAHWAERRAAWGSAVADLQASGREAVYLDTTTVLGPGNSHFPMMDGNNAEVLDALLATASWV